eukprot:TRINITY_DN111790_c0_g1_i1.p2 TRINITY_DN111790_c0_g1~~TRINITY_DN111790_c0_g1_i1.p2  ORF type:complete len:140 (-),score=27.13 TRINITY_DN111790_c0_g1_i1:24-443(-)
MSWADLICALSLCHLASRCRAADTSSGAKSCIFHIAVLFEVIKSKTCSTESHCCSDAREGSATKGATRCCEKAILPDTCVEAAEGQAIGALKGQDAPAACNACFPSPADKASRRAEVRASCILDNTGTSPCRQLHMAPC